MKKLKIGSIYLKTILFLLPFIAIMTDFHFDNDFWFTINQDRYILSNGFPHEVIGTVHHGLSFIYQSYGTGLLFYLIYNTFGKIGIMLLLITIVQLTSYFFYKLCHTISNNKKISLLVTMFFIFFYSLFFAVTRPHIFTILNLTIILYLLEKYIKENKIKYLIPIPIIGLLQINMHGIYLLPILIIITPYLINSFKFKIKFLNLESTGYNKKPLFITYIITFLVGFINPYTYKTLFYGLTSYTNALMKKTIFELASPSMHNIHGQIIILLMVTCYLIYYFNRNKKIPLRYLLLILGTTIMVLDAVKSASFFALCAIFPLAYLAYRDKDIKEKLNKRKIIINSLIVICTITILSLTIKFRENPQEAITKELVDYNTVENAKVYTSFENGSYLEYMGFNCYIDPRAEVFIKANNKKEDILDEYFNLQKGKLSYQEFLKKYDFDYLFIEKENDILYYDLRIFPIDNYELIKEDKNYEIWQKKTKLS